MEQNVNQDEQANKFSAEVRIRKTQVFASYYFTVVVFFSACFHLYPISVSKLAVTICLSLGLTNCCPSVLDTVGWVI